MPPSAPGALFLLRPGEGSRVWPFFLVYLLLFGALTLAEGVSMALFVQRIGADQLPRWYGAMAVANLVLVGGYVTVAERMDGSALFRVIIGGCGLAFAGLWWLLQAAPGGHFALGSLFAVREIAYTLFLMHFGTWLQDFFTRDELSRIMPMVYAGGRVGGIVGGGLLALTAGRVPLEHALLGCGLLSLAAAAASLVLERALPRPSSVEDTRGDVGLRGGGGRSAQELDEEARASWRGFARFLRLSPLGWWYSVLSVIFVFCRWLLHYQYSVFLEGHFEGEAAMAAFLGRYAQVALAVSLVLQLFVVNRIVLHWGLHAAQLLYAGLQMLAFAWLVAAPSLGSAVWARFVETELRFGLRNPVNQLVLNKFSKVLRVRMRAWSIGVIIPAGTAGAAVGLSMLAAWTAPAVLAWTGAGFGVAYLAASLRMLRTFEERPPAPGTPTG